MSLESFVEREIELLDESGECSTHTINTLLCLQSRVDGRLRKADEAAEVLERACSLYCRWSDTGAPTMDGGAMAYELVSFIRMALSKLKGEA